MDNRKLMQGGNRFAQLADNPNRFRVTHGALMLHMPFQRFARDEVVHHHKLFGQLIGCSNMWQTLAGAFRKSRPNTATGNLGRDLLANKRTGSRNGNQFGYAAHTLRQYTLHLVGVIDMHGKHNLVIVQDSSCYMDRTKARTYVKGACKPAVQIS